MEMMPKGFMLFLRDRLAGLWGAFQYIGKNSLPQRTQRTPRKSAEVMGRISICQQKFFITKNTKDTKEKRRGHGTHFNMLAKNLYRKEHNGKPPK